MIHKTTPLGDTFIEWVKTIKGATVIECIDNVVIFKTDKYRIRLQPENVAVAIHKDFDRWAISSFARMARAPKSAQDLQRIVIAADLAAKEANPDRELDLQKYLNRVNIKELRKLVLSASGDFKLKRR